MRISDWSSDVCSSDLSGGDSSCHRVIIPMVSLLTEVLASRKMINPGGDLIMQRLLSGLVAGVALAGASLFAAPAEAEYPGRPNTVILPWAAGGGPDAHARTTPKGTQDRFGIPG